MFLGASNVAMTLPVIHDSSRFALRETVGATLPTRRPGALVRVSSGAFARLLLVWTRGLVFFGLASCGHFLCGQERSVSLFGEAMLKSDVFGLGSRK